jgi:hypothetical protein
VWFHPDDRDVEMSETQEHPRFEVGDGVRTRDGLDGTPRSGVLARRIWHVREASHAYWIRDVQGRKVSRRYWAEDLVGRPREA